MTRLTQAQAGKAGFEFRRKLTDAIEYDETNSGTARHDGDVVVILTTGERVLVTFQFSPKEDIR